MLIQRLWATPGLLHQVLCRELLPESPKPSKLAWPSEAAPKRHLHRVYQALQKAWHSFVVQRALCLFMASSCAIATRCNLPNKLSMPRSLHPLLLAVVRDKLGMPVAQLIVLLKVAFQLHGHSTNDASPSSEPANFSKSCEDFNAKDSTPLKSVLKRGNNLPMSSLSFSVYLHSNVL